MGKLLEKIGSLSASVQLGLAVGLLALVVGGYFYWAYLPTSEELERARVKLGQVQAKLEESRRAAAELPKFKEEVARLNEQLIVALAQLPEEKDIPDLLSQVSRVGQESGLEVLTFRPGPEVPQSLYARIPVSMSANGTFHQLLTFFDRVSRLPRIVTVSDVAFSSPKEVNSRILLGGTFTVTTYRFLPDSNAGAAARGPAKGGKGGK
jgi:type IV pilus assembly protein PilO